MRTANGMLLQTRSPVNAATPDLDALYIRNHAPSDNLHNHGLIWTAGLQQDAIVGSNLPPPASCLLKESERVVLEQEKL